MNLKFTFALLIVQTIMEVAFACHGYKLNVHHAKNCPGSTNNVIKISNATATMNNKCQIIPEGCAETDGFTMSNMKYKILKNGLPVMRGTADLCMDVNDEGAAVLSMLGLPQGCPVKKMKVCGGENKILDISKYSTFLPLASGKIDIECTVTHDNGGQSCIMIQAEITK